MPWWIWLVLVLLMLAVLIADGAYACARGYQALKGVAKVGGRASKRFEAMSKPLPQVEEDTAPFFTRPLKDATDRYADAHAEVIRRQGEKRTRHARQWTEWKHFND